MAISLASRRQGHVPGIWWQRLKGGQLAESWQVWDTLAMLQQLDVIPAPAAA